jgi:hypothetical protein
MPAIVDVLIRGKYEADMAFISLQNALKLSNDGVGQAVGKLRQWTDGFMDIKAGWDMASGAAQAAFSTMQQVYNATVTETVEYATQVRNLSMTIGATAEESSKLIQAASDMGVSFDTLSAAMEGAIRKGAEPSIAGIAKLSDQYNAIQDPIERTRFLMETFGRAGADLQMLMQQGAAGIRELGQAAEDAGLVMDERAVQAARNYELALDNLYDKLDAAKIKVGNTFIPSLTSVIDAMVETDEETEKSGLTWTRYVPILGSVVQAFGATTNVIENAAEQSKKAADEIIAAQNKLNTYAGNIPIVGHGKSYKAGQGPAYPYGPDNPEGYVMDPQTGAKSYPGRATGVGPLVGGVPYMVGESGPEIFRPSGSGYITPAGAGGGGGNISLSLTLQSLVGIRDQMEAKRILYPAIEQIMREMKQSGKI